MASSKIHEITKFYEGTNTNGHANENLKEANELHHKRMRYGRFRLRGQSVFM
jgi:hypothetical protein